MILVIANIRQALSMFKIALLLFIVCTGTAYAFTLVKTAI